MEEEFTAQRAAEIAESYSQKDTILRFVRKAALRGEREYRIIGILSERDRKDLIKLGYEVEVKNDIKMIRW